MKTSSAVSWFEIAVTDMTRAIRFYNEVLGVELKANTWGDGEIAVFPYTQGQGVGGALLKHPSLSPHRQGAIVYLPATNVSDALDRASAAGGAVVVQKTPVGPDMGFFGRFVDSEGKRDRPFFDPVVN